MTRKTRVRKPLFCEDFCEAAAQHEITSRPSKGKFYCPLWRSLSSNPPYAGFLFRSAAQAMCYLHDQPGWQASVFRLLDVFLDGLCRPASAKYGNGVGGGNTRARRSSKSALAR